MSVSKNSKWKVPPTSIYTNNVSLLARIYLYTSLFLSNFKRSVNLSVWTVTQADEIGPNELVL